MEAFESSLTQSQKNFKEFEKEFQGILGRISIIFSRISSITFECPEAEL